MNRQPHAPDGPGRGASRRASPALDRVVLALTLAALLTHPCQVIVRHWALLAARALGAGQALAESVPAFNVTVSDCLVLAAFVLWLCARWRSGTLRAALTAYPLPLLALFACALLSVPPLLKFGGPGSAGAQVAYGRSARQLVQLVLLFGCAYLLLADQLSAARRRRLVLMGFFAAVAVALLVGLTQYARLRPPAAAASRGALVSPHQVDATFGLAAIPAGPHEQVGTSSNRNVLGAWLTLVVPLLWSVFLFGPRPWARWAALPFAVAGGVLLLHGGLWAAALLAVLALSLARSRLHFAATAAGMLLCYGLLFSLAPQRPGEILLDSLMIRRSADRFRTLPLYSGAAAGAQAPAGADLESPPYSPWEQRYVEWQPALLALARNPLFGFGLGNYQRHINAFYSDPDHPAYRMPKAARNLMEPGGNPFYAVWLAETGFVGLLGFLWLMFASLQRAIATASTHGDPWMRCLKRGACAALGAAAAGSAFTDYWVRGVGLAFVLVLALAWARDEAHGNRAAQG